MKPFLILKTGYKINGLSEFAGDYEDWIAANLGAPADVIDVSVTSALPEPQAFMGVVITGSGAMVTEQLDWMRRTERWLVGLAQTPVPLLGICFGHQLMAHAFGGEVADNPAGIEVGTVPIRLTDEAEADPLFRHLSRRFPAHVTHQQSVIAPPRGAVVLACSDMDAHQAIRLGERMWSVQFHPEFSQAMMPHFIEFHRHSVGSRRQRLLQQLEETPESQGLLARFAELARTGA